MKRRLGSTTVQYCTTCANRVKKRGSEISRRLVTSQERYIHGTSVLPCSAVLIARCLIVQSLAFLSHARDKLLKEPSGSPAFTAVAYHWIRPDDETDCIYLNDLTEFAHCPCHQLCHICHLSPAINEPNHPNKRAIKSR